ncbi:MAG: helix-turn-helix transcriptional regulator [Tyzzerella sp.]|nr:helix-turn-helix transcriptional regulator [Tyzzerella sp.]
MQLSEYLEVGKKMKTARTNAGMSQRDMAIKLSVSNSAYSNYENGYSEPPAEIIIKFCDVLDITLENLLELKVATPKSPTVKTFADFIYILIDLDRRGLQIKGNTTYSQRENQLMAHLSLDIKNAQLATFIPDWNNTNKKLATGLIDELEYENWLDDILRIFNVTIDEFI